MKMDDTKRNNIQILRGIAIIAVVFIHNTPNGLPQILCRPFLNFSVGLFIFLSGMLSNVEKWNPRKRITKVVIPYIIWTLVYVVMYHYKNLSAIPVAYIKALLTGNAAAIMYYIFVYCEFTLLIPLIDRLARSKYRYLGFLISPVEIIFMRLIPLITGYEMNSYIRVLMGISCLGWFTYYYLGYMLGNGLIRLKSSTPILIGYWVTAIILQIAEGFWYFSMGESNCGTQVKLTSILAGSVFMMLTYRFLESSKKYDIKFLKLLGDCSFGVYFSHLAVMTVLGHIPYYADFVIYPLNAVLAIILSLICVLLGRKILGKYAKYLAL